MPNKKRIREALEKLYDRLYSEAEAVLNQYNPCQVGRCSAGIVCTEWREFQKPEAIKSSDNNAQPNTLCCIRCRYHSPTKGCQADRPLTCKLWLCSAAKICFPVAEKKLAELRDRAKIFYYYRGNRKMSIDEAFTLADEESLIGILKQEKIDI